MSVLDKVRRWIDGDTNELVLENAARDAQVKPRSKAEEFIVQIAREVEAVMQAEMLPLPQGTVMIPSEYLIFLSEEDDKEWRGVKRRGLEQGLYHILAERAKELVGKKKLETKSFVIELRIDGTLDKGTVRVQPSWEDVNNKTGVLKRPANIPELKPRPADQPVTPHSATDPNITGITGQIPGNDRSSREISQAVPLTDDNDEATRVAPRNAELYKIEVWRGNVRQSVLPVFKNEIVIGRGSRSKPVDVPLTGDVEVSRQHIRIQFDGAKFWAVNEGRNPAVINNFDLPSGQRISVAPGTPINVCSFMLKIQS